MLLSFSTAHDGARITTINLTCSACIEVCWRIVFCFHCLEVGGGQIYTGLGSKWRANRARFGLNSVKIYRSVIDTGYQPLHKYWYIAYIYIYIFFLWGCFININIYIHILRIYMYCSDVRVTGHRNTNILAQQPFAKGNQYRSRIAGWRRVRSL